MQLSALKGDGIADFWVAVEQIIDERQASGEFEKRRRGQALSWMWDNVRARLLADFHAHPAIRAALPGILQDVSEARVAPSAAARALLERFEHS